MRLLRTSVYALAAMTACVLAAPGHAYAYVDPGTGSYVMQIIMAAFLAASFTLKVFWKNVKAFFSGLFTRGKAADDKDSG